MFDRRLNARLRLLWLSEAIRNKEGGGSIEDVEAIGHLARDTGLRDAGDEELIFQRAKLLARTNRVAKALPENIDFVLSCARYALIGLAALAFLLGSTAAAAVFSRGYTINISSAIIALLAPHLASLTLMALVLLIGARSGNLSLANAWLWLSERIGRRRDAIFLVESLRALVSRGSSLPWLMMGVSHLLWLLFALGSIVSVSLFLMIHEYAFEWTTTILPGRFFVRAVEILGWLPGLLGFVGPSSTDVATLTNVDAVRKAWAAWLIGSLLAYGFIPRLLLLAVSYWTAKSGLRKLSLDGSNAYYLALVQRIRAAFKPPRAIVDPDPGNVGATGRDPAVHSGRTSAAATSAVVPFELRDPASLAGIVTSDHLTVFENVLDHRSQAAILARLGDLNVQRLAFVCDARNAADRGAFQFLRVLKSVCPECRVVLLEQDSTRPDKLANWLAGFGEVGFDGGDVAADIADFGAWLGRA